MNSGRPNNENPRRPTPKPQRPSVPIPREAEESLIGAIILDAGPALDAALRCGLTPDDFGVPQHGLIYDAALDARRDGDPIDSATIAEELRRAGHLDICGGYQRLVRYASDCPAVANAYAYAKATLEGSTKRRLMELSSKLLTQSRNGQASDEIIATLTGHLEGLRRRTSPPEPGRGGQIDGATFILDMPPETALVWGDRDHQIWTQGETFILCGPEGVGKTTLAQQIVLGLTGMVDQALALPVTPMWPVLYIAADRPSQTARSMRRMVGEPDRLELAERLIVWQGPPPFDIGKDTAALASFAEERGAKVCVIDSLKDVALSISEDIPGVAINRSLQSCLAKGIEILALHHQRKEQPGAGKPRHIADVYGSRWITAGAGSVIMLWGDPGDIIVSWDHLKQPAEPVGPWTLIHDHDTGLTTRRKTDKLLDIVIRFPQGATAADVAMRLYDSLKPDRNQLERANRALTKGVTEGYLTVRPGRTNPPTPTKWAARIKDEPPE